MSRPEPIRGPVTAHPVGKRQEATPLTASPPAPATRRVGRNVAALTAAQLITWAMTLLWTLIVPRKLGPEGLGTVMAAWSATEILGLLLGLGARNYLVRMSVVEPDAAASRIGTTLVLRAALSPLVFAAAFGYGEAVGWDHDAKLVLLLAAAATVFVRIAEPLQAGFQSTERMEYLAYSDVISKSGQGIVGIAVVLIGFGTIGVTASWAVMAGIVIFLDLYWLRSYVRVDFRTNVRHMATIARESLPYWASGIFFMFYLWIDFVMLSLLTKPEVVGWYAVPTRLFHTLMFLPVVVSTAWLPRFVQSFEKGGGELRRTAQRPLELVLLLSLPIGAMTAIAAGPMIDVLYGSEYAHSVPVMALLALSIPLMYMNIMFCQVLVAMGRQASWTKVMAATIVVNPLFNLALIPLTQQRFDNGAIGAAISLLLTELVVVGAGLVLAGRFVFDGGTVRRTVLGVAAAAPMWVVAYGVARAAGGAASIAAGALTFLVTARALRVFTPGEIAQMKGALVRAVNRLPRRCRRPLASARRLLRRRAARPTSEKAKARHHFSVSTSSFVIPSLDGIRALAVMAVFLVHAGVNGSPGPLGVTVFFFLSGYLITTLLRIEFKREGRISLRNFYLRRAFRILPPLYVVLAAAYVLTILEVLGAQKLRLTAGLSQFFFLSNYQILSAGWDGPQTGRPPGTGALWSLAVEEHFYLLFPLLYLILSRKVPSPRRQVLILSTICAAVLVWRLVLILGMDASFDRTYAATDTRIDSILFGCILAIAANPVLDDSTVEHNSGAVVSAIKRFWAPVTAPIALIVMVALSRSQYVPITGTIQYTVDGLALFPLFIVAIRYHDWGILRLLNWPAVTFVGMVSYSIYIMHEIVIAAVHDHVPAGQLVHGALYLVVTLFIAWIIHRLVERPLGRVRRRLTGSRPKRAVAQPAVHVVGSPAAIRAPSAPLTT